MSMMSEYNRHEFDLLDLCGRIHGAYSGSGDGLPYEEAAALRAWLRVRVNDFWHPEGELFWRYDNAVRALCVAALQELEEMVDADRRSLIIAVTDEIIRARDGGAPWPMDPDRILAAFNPSVLQREAHT